MARESCTTTELELALQRCDELGYPVEVNGTVHAKKADAVAAVNKALSEGASVTVARPEEGTKAQEGTKASAGTKAQGHEGTKAESKTKK